MRSALVDLSALEWNIRRLGQTVRGRAVDVRADAYGHGARQVARIAAGAGASVLLVADEEERAELASSGSPLPIEIDAAPDAGPDEELTAAVYGAGPLVSRYGLRPVLRVAAHVISLKTIEEGEPVSYGYTWRAPTRTTLALVPLGYADGVSRRAGNGARALVGTELRPVVGRVAMDVFVLDLGVDQDDAGRASRHDRTPGTVALGDEVVIFGDASPGSPSVDDWAASVGMTALEVTSSIGRRVPRSWS